jgi:hypothetical protein
MCLDSINKVEHVRQAKQIYCFKRLCWSNTLFDQHKILCTLSILCLLK